MRKIISSALALTIAAVWIISSARPTQATNVYTTREDGSTTDTFAMGENVRIVAYSTDPCPYEIVIIDSEGVIRYTETCNTPNYEKVLNGITDKPGWWEVKAGATSTRYATAFFNVIPEIPFGTLSILLTCFAALGISLLQKRVKWQFP